MAPHHPEAEDPLRSSGHDALPTGRKFRRLLSWRDADRCETEPDSSWAPTGDAMTDYSGPKTIAPVGRPTPDVTRTR